MGSDLILSSPSQAIDSDNLSRGRPIVLSADAAINRRRKRGRLAQNAYRQRQIDRISELEVQVNYLEGAVKGVAGAAGELDGALRTHLLKMQTRDHGTRDSVRQARQKLSHAVQLAMVECSPGSSVGSMESTPRTSKQGPKRRSCNEKAEARSQPAEIGNLPPIIHIPRHPPSLFIAEEGSSFSTILLWQALVIARFHLKNLLQSGTGAEIVERMFTFTFRHESPANTMQRISSSLQARYVDEPCLSSTFRQVSEMVRLHDCVVLDLVRAGDQPEDYLDVYQVEAYLRRLCASPEVTKIIGAHSLPISDRAKSPGLLASVEIDALPSQQFLSTLIKTLAPRGICFGDGPRYKADIVNWTLHEVLQLYRFPSSYLDTGFADWALSGHAEPWEVADDKYWRDLWVS